MSETPAPKPARRSNLAEIQCPPEVDALALLLGETREEFVAAATSQRVEDIRGKLRAVLPARRRTFPANISPEARSLGERLDAEHRALGAGPSFDVTDRGAPPLHQALGAPAHFDPRHGTKTLAETGDRAPFIEGNQPGAVPMPLLSERAQEQDPDTRLRDAGVDPDWARK